MEARDLDEERDRHVHGFLKTLMVRDLRHLARGRGVENYKTMPKKELLTHLFSAHFMQKRDKEKFSVVKDQDPVPNFATPQKGLVQRSTLNRYGRQLQRPGAEFAERIIETESHPPPLPVPMKSAPSDSERRQKAQNFMAGLTLDNLRLAAARMKIQGYSKLRREDLMEAILEKGLTATAARKQKEAEVDKKQAKKGVRVLRNGKPSPAAAEA